MSEPTSSSPPAAATTVLREIDLYTDGACSGNPGRGGWAFTRDRKTKELTGAGGERDSTNNRMELKAVIEGLKSLKKRCRVALHSDSNYVLQGFKSGWQAGRRRVGFAWRGARKSQSKT